MEMEKNEPTQPKQIEIGREEFVKKYGEIEVEFSSYYKFTFTYSGETKKKENITVDVGGNSDDIYRFEVAPGVKEKIKDMGIYSGYAYLKNKIEYFYDY